MFFSKIVSFYLRFFFFVFAVWLVVLYDLFSWNKSFYLPPKSHLSIRSNLTLAELCQNRTGPTRWGNSVHWRSGARESEENQENVTLLFLLPFYNWNVWHPRVVLRTEPWWEQWRELETLWNLCWSPGNYEYWFDANILYTLHCRQQSHL